MNMRKIKLFFLTLALLVGGGNSIWAQKDVTSQYITNATLSNGTTGWTVTHKQDGPAQGNNTAGYAMEFYAGWGALNVTSYGATQNITLPAGHYTLVNYSFFRQGQNFDTDASKSLGFLKAGNQQVALKTLGSITAGGYANSMVEGANVFDSKMYRNTIDFTIDENNTSIEIGVTGTFDAAYSWCILGQFELINNDIPATMDAPFDVTGYITNPGFEYHNMTGWNVTGGIHAHNGDQPFKVGSFFAENWQQSGALPEGSMSQTLTDLPAGYYKLTANLGGDGTYIDLNGKTANWETDKDYTVGYVLAEDEDLVITAGKTAEGTANWIHFDNFRLQFCGDVAAALTTLCAEVTNYESKLSASDYTTLQSAVNGYNKSYSDVDELLAAIEAVQALYESANLYVEYTTTLADANAIDQQSPMNSDVLAALQSAIGTTVTMASSASDKVSAKEALNTAISNANTSIANYTEAKNIIDAANGYDATGQTSYSANETVVAIKAAYDARTLTAVTTEQKNAANEALATACKAQTQPTDGCDMTAYIQNWDFLNCAENNFPGWTINKPTGYAKPLGTSAVEYWTGTAANGSFDYYQTLTDLPTGVYTIQAYMWNSENSENVGGVVNGQAGVYGTSGAETVFKGVMTECTDANKVIETTDEIQIVNGELRLGVKNNAKMEGRWFGVDWIKLTYVRQLNTEEKEAIAKANAVAAYNEAIAAAQAIAEGTIPTTAYTNLSTVITNNTLSDGTASQYNAAATALNEAVDDAQPLVAPYTAWKAMKAYADALVAVANDNTTANGTFATAISDQNTDAEAATNSTAIETATSTLKTAMVTYAGAANPVGDGKKFNLTFMLTNPDLSVFTANGKQDGWYTDQDFATQNSQVMMNNASVANSTDNTKYAMYEYWSAASSATSGYTVYTKVELPEGTYRMDALCMTGWGYQASSPDGKRNITFSAGDVDGTSIVTSTLEPATLDFVQTTAGEVKIGLKAHEGNTCNWMGIGYVELYKVPAQAFIISEDIEYDTAQEGAGNVTLTRTIKENAWNTIWLPFSMTEEELKSTFGNDVQIAEYEEVANDDNSTINFNVMATPAISPLKPVLLKTSTAGTSYTINARTLVAGTPSIIGNNFDFVGTTAASTIAKDNYFIGTSTKDDKSKLFKSSGETTIKGTRAYLKANSSEARIIKLSIDGEEVTAVEGIKVVGINNGKIYNLNGQEVKNAQKGIFIQNGKKIVVK